MHLQIIENKIYEVRGYKIMLDFDLAELYETETKYLKRAVKNSIARFPSDFMFELTKAEWESLRCNFSTSKQGGIRYMPYAFTEQGVAMLSSVLNSNKAIEINIAIMRAFLVLRNHSLKHKDLLEVLKKLEKKYDQKFIDIEEVLDYLIQKDQQDIQQHKRKRIGYKLPKK